MFDFLTLFANAIDSLDFFQKDILEICVNAQDYTEGHSLYMTT